MRRKNPGLSRVENSSNPKKRFLNNLDRKEEIVIEKRRAWINPIKIDINDTS